MRPMLFALLLTALLAAGSTQADAAFDAHAVADHTKKFRPALGLMLGAPHDDRVYAAVE